MHSFDDELNLRLAGLREQGLFRELRRVDSAQGPCIKIGGKIFLNFSSNDYLGLANHPALKEAAIKAVEKFGAGAGASRLVCGSLAPFHELEESLAAFKKTEASLTFSTGYAAAMGTITALVGKDDVIVLDKLVHASIVDAAKLSEAKLRIFDHNDLDDLEKILTWADKLRTENGKNKKNILIVTESIFSMDGDAAPLREIAGLKDKYGAWLMVDEAHATGLYGKNHRGLAEALDISDRIEIQMGTLGKAIGASGGYICGSRVLMDFLVNRARNFIFSTAPVPAAAAAAKAGIELLQSPEGERRCQDAWNLAKLLEHSTGSAGIYMAAPDSLIMPLIIGSEDKAVAISSALRESAIFVPAIRFPTVSRGSARLRITLTAAHSPNDVGTLVNALSSAIKPA